MELARQLNREIDPSFWDLVTLAPIFAIGFPVCRFFLDRFVLEKLSRKSVFGTHESKLRKLSDADRDALRKTQTKFKESGWKCVYYTTAEIFALYVTYNETWLTDSYSIWVGPGDQTWPNQTIKVKLKLLYAFAAGFYAYSIFALIFWETRRKDFGVSMTHHVATFGLISFSYWTRFARIGCVVLALHDASDVFLELAKMSKYAGVRVVPDVLFGLFALSWVLLRLIYFPVWVIWGTSYLSIKAINIHLHRGYGPIYYYVTNTLLISLFVLHIYWWVLIYRMIVKQIRAGVIGDDVRSGRVQFFFSRIVLFSVFINWWKHYRF
ncbi:hypothetical protein SELMODRAFT_78320 [Selaginella moellendorffii]|uniref:TLC domain-containing protein n=1 Tax=Selaginella moellendorffii TaxID=88036 RepID=D8QUF1_SELML|nr:hypothetical protein SELMODRAFT_78320 [Selaginella moellendorffii]